MQVVAPSELCDKISDALHVAAKEKKCQIVVHQCEFIAEVLKPKSNLAVDFIIFVIDGQTTQSINEVGFYFIFSQFIWILNQTTLHQFYITSGELKFINKSYNIPPGRGKYKLCR